MFLGLMWAGYLAMAGKLAAGAVIGDYEGQGWSAIDDWYGMSYFAGTILFACIGGVVLLMTWIVWPRRRPGDDEKPPVPQRPERDEVW